MRLRSTLAATPCRDPPVPHVPQIMARPAWRPQFSAATPADPLLLSLSRLRVLGWFSAPLSLFAAQCSVLSEVLHLHNTLCIALSDQTMRTFQIPDSEGGIQQILRLPSVQSRRQLNELPDFASHSPRKSTESPGF
jgi:hypothetical protein